MAAGAVPVARHGLGIDGGGHVEVLGDAVEQPAGHPDLVGGLQRAEGADLELPLAHHHLGVGAGDGEAAVRRAVAGCPTEAIELIAAGSRARPVLNTAAQVQRWRDFGSGRPCDVMVDTGMNRLGLSVADVAGGLLEGLEIETLMSHLACADEDEQMNARQRDALVSVAARVPAKRLSLANSAGICLGADYAFDLTRPGLALYGGVPRREAAGHIRQVARVEAEVVQRKRIEKGACVGYNATFTAERRHELAIVNIGYGDGYLRGFSGTGRARIGEAFAPVVGRVSMDLAAICVDEAPEVKEGDWIELDYDLPSAAAQSGLTQYEVLTTLGSRFERIWR